MRPDAEDFSSVAGEAGPLFAAPVCEICGGVGWVSTEKDGVATASRCPECWTPGREDGPFTYSPNQPSEIERVIAGMIWRHRGRDRALSIEKIAAASGKTDRTVKGVVESLIRDHKSTPPHPSAAPRSASS